MSDILNLYRGDSILNENTNPGSFRSEGIRSSAFGGGGDPRNIEKMGALTTIKTHIDHVTAVEKNYYKITDFISFTEDEAIAQKWAADLNPDQLLPCMKSYEETRYVFHVSIPKFELKSISKGVWHFNYHCTPHKRKANHPNDFIKTMVLQQAGCDVCGGIHPFHSLILIKPSLVFQAIGEQENLKRAVRLANKNDEWLLLPNDMMDQGQFRRTRIYFADFWKADLYVKKGEPARTPDSFQIK